MRTEEFPSLLYQYFVNSLLRDKGNEELCLGD